MEPTIKKPIARSKELVPLSKEHHDGLLLCWKIRTGLKAAVATDRIGAYVLSFYNADLKEHFRQEEEYLFNLLPDADDLKAIAMAQHITISSKIAAIDHNSGSELLEDIAHELETHIRFEERVLFGHIERTIDPQILKHIGQKLNDLSKKHCKHTWKDEFWAYKK